MRLQTYSTVLFCNTHWQVPGIRVVHTCIYHRRAASAAHLFAACNVPQHPYLRHAMSPNGHSAAHLLATRNVLK
jgi:hypothetical protein